MPRARAQHTPPFGMSTNRRISLAAALLAASAVLSRLLGFARDSVIAWRMGATPETDAYYAAFWLPDLLYYLLAGGALSITFVPLFSRQLAAGDEARGWRLFSNIATVIGIVLAAAIALAWWQAPTLTALMYPEFGADQVALVSSLTRVVLPGPLLFFAGGLLAATELTRKRFGAAALAPLLYNLGIIAGGLLLAPALGIAGFSWGVLVGALAGPFLVPLVAAWKSVRYRPSFDLRDPDLRRFARLALPLMLGFSLLTVDEWIGRYFASGMDAGSITWLNNARRLMLVPVAVIGQALGAAALPFLSDLAARGEHRRMEETLASSLRGTATLSTIAAAALAMAALPAVGLVYGHGAYSPQDAEATAALLGPLAFAAIGWCVQSVLLRGFYAREETFWPMIASTGVAAASVPLYGALGANLGVEGLAWGTVVGVTLNAAVIAELYRRRFGAEPWRPILLGAGTGVVCALPACLAATLILRLARDRLPADGTTLRWMVEGAAIALCFALLSLPALLALGGPGADAVRARLRRLRARGSGRGSAL